jgi:hypothetical protein
MNNRHDGSSLLRTKTNNKFSKSTNSNNSNTIAEEEIVETSVRTSVIKSNPSSPEKTSNVNSQKASGIVASIKPFTNVFKSQENSKDVEDVLPEAHILPSPGYVIKTRRVNVVNNHLDDEKVFINVHHHFSIGDIQKTLFLTAPEGSLPGNDYSNVPTFILPKIYLGTATDTKDKGGNKSSLYNVVISSAYFASGMNKKATDVTVVQKVSLFTLLIF